MIYGTAGIIIYIIMQLEILKLRYSEKKKFERSLSERIILFIETIEINRETHQSQEGMYFNNNNEYCSLTFISEIHCNYLNFIFVSKYSSNKFVILNVEY